MYRLFLIFLLSLSQSVNFLPAQERLPDPEVDILRYRFFLEIEENSDVVKGATELIVRFPQAGTSVLELDLDEEGMTVKAVELGKEKCRISHKNQRLSIQLPSPSRSEDTLFFRVQYVGTPQDGLIISKNKYGDRTFFGDNWPNRAHYWLPTVDHPADKAYCEFIVTAPDQYQVVANGEMIEESDTKPGYRLTHWHSTVPLPTKVMVMGSARFAVQYVGEYKDIPVSSWVYPQDRDKGFYDYELALQVLAFMDDYIGPYPYAKLANVQSKTRYGGMENASNIFYSESSVTGDRTSETLIAHEVAHQWFGNSASEASWYHIWLSEGFATYFTALYLEATYGRESMETIMESNRSQVLTSFASKGPVVDPSISDLNALLSTNAYQKGGWILHMLRHKVGDEAFKHGVRSYYDRFKLSNALSKDFQEVMEEVSGQDLESFFQQWLYQPGFPELKLVWEYDARKRRVHVTVTQTQMGKPFEVPLEIGIRFQQDGPLQLERLELEGKESSVSFKVQTQPEEIVLDPGMWLLFGEG